MTGDADPTDRELLRAHVAGDPDAFGTVFGRHRDRLWAVALRTTGNPEDAADALQDAMVSAFRRAEGYRGDAAVTTWLHRIVVNACLDRLRHARVRRAEPLPEDLDEPGRHHGAAVDVATPEQAALAGDRRRLVLEALATLPVEQRAALVLVDMEGWSVAEAAAALDCAEGTVKSRCARGRARLAPLLEAALEDRDEPRAGASGNPPASRPVTSTDPPRGPPVAPA